MKTLLIYPPFHRLHGITNRFFPIGLGYLAGALREAGREAAIYNAENFDRSEPLVRSYAHSDAFGHFDQYQRALDDAGHYVWQEARRVIADYRPGLVGITAKSCMVPAAQMLSRIVKEVDPSIKVAWGGPHASIAPDETIGFENVDMAVRHEGERTIVELVEQLAAGQTDLGRIAGLVWKDSLGRTVHNRLRENEPDVDKLPMPDKTADLFPGRYAPDDYGVMFTSRGCPWPCTFCDSRGVWTRRIRYRSPEHVVAEMERLYAEQGVRDFYFWDDTFTPNRRHSMRLFELMIETFPRRGRPITWQATTRCDCVDDELARLMKRSGCRLLTYGIETGSPAMMKILRKGITHEKVFEAQRVMRRAGIRWDAFFMIGFPDDTPETIDETRRLIRRLECTNVSISIFTPYPGTAMYDRARSYGLVSEPIEWRYYSHQSPRNHFVRDIPRDQFARIVEEALGEVDHINASRYFWDRVRFFATHPTRVPGKIWRMLWSAGA